MLAAMKHENLKQFISEFEEAASGLGLAPSTLGRLVGLGGDFHARVKAGRRVWPETIEKARCGIDRIRAERVKGQ